MVETVVVSFGYTHRHSATTDVVGANWGVWIVFQGCKERLFPYETEYLWSVWWHHRYLISFKSPKIADKTNDITTKYLKRYLGNPFRFTIFFRFDSQLDILTFYLPLISDLIMISNGGLWAILIDYLDKIFEDGMSFRGLCGKSRMGPG